MKYKITKALLEKLYINQNKGYREVAKIIGCDHNLVRYYVHKYKLLVHKSGIHKSSMKNKTVLTSESLRRYAKKFLEKNVLINLYVKKEMTCKQIAKKLNCGKVNVWKYLKLYKIKTRKNHSPWNKGKTGYKLQSASVTKKRLYREGKLQVWNKGLTVQTDERVKKQEEQRRKTRVYIAGISWGKHTEEAKSKLSLSHGGNGIPYSNTEYGSEFDNNLKEQVRFRDSYKCRECGCSQLENGRCLDVHHKDYNKKNNALSNLIALCIRCHKKTNYNRQYWQEHFSNLLPIF